MERFLEDLSANSPPFAPLLTTQKTVHVPCSLGLLAYKSTYAGHLRATTTQQERRHLRESGLVPSLGAHRRWDVRTATEMRWQVEKSNQQSSLALLPV